MAEENFIELKGKDTPPIVLKTPDDVTAWINKEDEFWSWARTDRHTELGVAGHGQRDAVFNQLRQAKRALKGYGSSNAAEHKSNLLKHLQAYVDAGLVSETARAQFIDSLRQQDDGLTALAALSTFVGESFSGENSQPAQHRYATKRGQFAMFMFDAGLNAEDVSRARAAFKQLTDTTDAVLRANWEEHSRLVDRVTATTEEIRALDEKRLKTFSETIALRLGEFDDAKTKSINEINATKEQYSALMEVQGPVEYWEKKAATHKTNADAAEKRLYSYAKWAAPSLLLAYAIVFGVGIWKHDAIPKEAWSLLVLVTAALAVTTTIAFWIARFLTRLFLSERHMFIDATSRATMARTFLALSASEKVAKEDRVLVLQPLFRAGTDGIIQDDTTVDGAVTLLARALEKR